MEVEVRPAESISPGVHHARGNMAGQSTNTSQHQQLDAAAPEFYPEGVVEGSDQGEDLPRVMVTPTLDWPHATNKGDVSRPMPVAGVMQKQVSQHWIRSTHTAARKTANTLSGQQTQ